MDDLLLHDATATADLLRRREISIRELAEAAITAIASTGKELNVLASDQFDRALKRAARAEPGPGLAGVPIVLKDLGCEQRGEPHWMGSFSLKAAGNRGVKDAAVVAELERAGLIVLGRTTTPEFGMRSTTESLAHGATLNPRNRAFSTGGSSGGSAAAVAAGLVPVAQGTDAGGSLRLPASWCGIVSLKPSRGRVSEAPDGETAFGHNTIGFCARSIRDLAATLDIAAGPAPGDTVRSPEPPPSFVSESIRPAQRLSIGIMTQNRIAGLEIHSACAAAVRRVGESLQALGHRVQEASPGALNEVEYLDHFVDGMAPGMVIRLRRMGQLLGREIGQGDVEFTTWFRYLHGSNRSAGQLAADLQWFEGYRRRMLAWWSDGFDILLLPVTPKPALRIGQLQDQDEDGIRRNMDYIRLTAPFNTSGQPVLVIPAGTSPDGVPLGVQLVADYGAEAKLLRLGSELERDQPWTRVTVASRSGQDAAPPTGS